MEAASREWRRPIVVRAQGGYLCGACWYSTDRGNAREDERIGEGTRRENGVVVNICRRCVYWDAKNQIAGLAARCALLTTMMQKTGTSEGVRVIPTSAVVITTGFDTCPGFALAKHDESGRRIDS